MNPPVQNEFVGGMPRYLNTLRLWKNSKIAAFYAAFIKTEPQIPTKTAYAKRFSSGNPPLAWRNTAWLTARSEFRM
jgi:hypothetical protein